MQIYAAGKLRAWASPMSLWITFFNFVPPPHLPPPPVGGGADSFPKTLPLNCTQPGRMFVHTDWMNILYWVASSCWTTVYCKCIPVQQFCGPAPGFAEKSFILSARLTDSPSNWQKCLWPERTELWRAFLPQSLTYWQTFWGLFCFKSLSIWPIWKCPSKAH